jgi:hypothetical protein
MDGEFAVATDNRATQLPVGERAKGATIPREFPI